jgi:hypothetical protein
MNSKRAAIAALALVLPSGCRAVSTSESVEFGGAASLGFRHASGWDPSSAPLLHLDGRLRPFSWPLGFEVSTTLSGYAGDQTGAQSVDLGIGIERTFELEPSSIWLSLGAGHLFVSTDSGDLFHSRSDSWGAEYVSSGLYFALGEDRGTTFGLEARYSFGDGPDLGGESLDGEFLDLYLVARFAN